MRVPLALTITLCGPSNRSSNLGVCFPYHVENVVRSSHAAAIIAAVEVGTANVRPHDVMHSSLRIIMFERLSQDGSLSFLLRINGDLL